MFLKPFTIINFGRNIIVLPESIIYEEIQDLKNENIENYIISLFEKFSNIINKSTYYQVILWSMNGKLNADIWTFDLKSWDYNTDINVFNFIDLELDTNHQIITNRDGFILLAQNEKNRLKYKNIDDFLDSF